MAVELGCSRWHGGETYTTREQKYTDDIAKNSLPFSNTSSTDGSHHFDLGGAASVDPYTFPGTLESPLIRSLTADGIDPVNTLALKGTSSATLKLPPKLAFLTVYGYVGPGYGIANISISPPPPANLTYEMTNPSTNRPWYASVPLLNTPLDPEVKYTLTVSTTPETAGGGVHLDYLKVYTSYKG